MINASILSWFVLILSLSLASFCGVSLSRLAPWSQNALRARVPFFFGLGIAPFIFGISTIVIMAISRGAPHSVHLMGTLILVASIALGAQVISRKLKNNTTFPGFDFYPSSLSSYEFITLVLLIIWMSGLLFDVLFMPLTQNDALEYAMVGRILFETRDLTSYPVLNSTSNTSGFYGPWTHPPLYVTLIYIMNVIQGHADTPGFMRIVSPWFALGATGIVYSIGNLRNKLTGLFSAIVFISAPLFFLGSGSALIDSLPIAGISAVLALIMGCSDRSFSRNIAIGLTLGLAMWTHSQAILFPVLTLSSLLIVDGAKGNFKRIFQDAVMIGMFTLLTASWPYWRNYAIFDSPISDNPIVFAFAKLNWPEYFRMARGYDSIEDKIQYGVFKGWFMLEAYSFSFWIMTLGLLFYAIEIFRSARKSSWKSTFSSYSGKTESISIWIFSTYLVGVCASIVIGTDLMIRNERYLLIMMPIVSHLSGYAVTKIISYEPEDKLSWKFLKYIFFLGITLVSCVQIYTLTNYRLKSLDLDLNISLLKLNHEEKMRKWPPHNAMTYLRNHTAESDLIFSMKPADMYYSQRRMVSYLDPRLLEFYSANNVLEAYKILTSLGVTHIHIPDYTIPPIYNSLLEKIIFSPLLTELVFSSEGFQIYKIRSSSSNGNCLKTDLTKLLEPWNITRVLVIGGRKGLFSIPLATSLSTKGEYIQGEKNFPFFNREFSTQLSTNYFYLDSPDQQEYFLKLKLNGNSLVSVLVGSKIKDKVIPLFRLGEVILTKNKDVVFEKRFKVASGSRGPYVLIFDYRTPSSISIEITRFEKITNSPHAPPNTITQESCY